MWSECFREREREYACIDKGWVIVATRVGRNERGNLGQSIQPGLKTVQAVPTCT